MSKFDRLLLVVIGMMMSATALAQETIKEKEKRMGDAIGIERLELLYELTTYYINLDDRKARKYARQANLLADNHLAANSEYTRPESVLIIMCKEQYGQILFQQESYLEAHDVFEASKQGAIDFKYPSGVARANMYLNLIDSLASVGKVKKNFLSKAFSNIDIGSALSNSTNSMATASELKLAKMSEKKGDTTMAIIHYKKASDLLRKRGQIQEANEIDDKILTYREINRIDSIRNQINYTIDNTGDLQVLDRI